MSDTRYKWKSIASSITACLGGLSHGAMLSWPADVLQQLAHKDSHLGYMDQNMLSWVASVNFIGCMIGAILSSIFLKFISERKILYLSSLTTGISWLMVGFSSSPAMLCCSRIALGVGNSMLMSLIPPYIASIAPPSLCGVLSSLYGLSLGLGLIYSVSAGAHLHWTHLSLVASAPAFLLFCSTPLLIFPCDDRVMLIDRSLQVSKRAPPPKVDRPFLLFGWLALMFILSGICPLSVFAEFLFTDNRTFQVEDIVLASNICQVIGGVLGAIAIDKVGRKPVLQVGAWICLLANILLSLFFSTMKDSQCPGAPGSVLCWTPAIATCLFFVGFGVGLGNIFFVLLGELVPAARASTIIPMVTFLLNLFQFSVIKCFLAVEGVIGLTSIFFIQAGFCLFFLLGQAAWLPETRPNSSDSGILTRGHSDRHAYGTFDRRSLQLDRFSTAVPNYVPENCEFVLDHTEFYTRLDPVTKKGSLKKKPQI